MYGTWQFVYTRFAKWQDSSTLEPIFHALTAVADCVLLRMDWRTQLNSYRLRGMPMI